MTHHISVSFDHPENAGILRYLMLNWWKKDIELKGGHPGLQVPPSISPKKVRNPYYSLGTHPDLVKWLWDDLANELPNDCRWVLYSRPVLVHPLSGIVFAFAMGVFTYGLRPPEQEFYKAINAGASRVYNYQDGSKFDLKDIGEKWIWGSSDVDEVKMCLVAFEYAGDTS